MTDADVTSAETSCAKKKQEHNNPAYKQNRQWKFVYKRIVPSKKQGGEN